MDTSYAAAWVPEQTGMDWAEAATLAVDWARVQGRPIVLLSEVLEQNWNIPALDRIPQANRFSRRSRYSGGGATIVAYVPSPEMLAQAIRGARGAALVVVEGFGNRVFGWAAAVGALDLVSGETTAPLTEEVSDAVDALAFVGNNGFADQYGKRDAKRIIAGLAQQDSFDGALLSSAVAAHGLSGSAVQRIREFCEAAGWQPEHWASD
jgi:hypothetical protein